jgi:AbrB family looped-hinge helix DNA binding protein
VIPKSMRDALGLKPGTPVDFQLEGESVSVRPRSARTSLGGIFKGGPDMAAELLKDRAREPR